MLKMSFYDATLDRVELSNFIKATDKKIRYSYGLGGRQRTTDRKLITKKEALDIVNEQSYLDANKEKHCLHLNAYSANSLY